LCAAASGRSRRLGSACDRDACATAPTQDAAHRTTHRNACPELKLRRRHDQTTNGAAGEPKPSELFVFVLVVVDVADVVLVVFVFLSVVVFAFVLVVVGRSVFHVDAGFGEVAFEQLEELVDLIA